MQTHELEELSCTCGAGHGSLEGHVDWCGWLKIKRRAARTAVQSCEVPAKTVTRCADCLVELPAPCTDKSCAFYSGPAKTVVER